MICEYNNKHLTRLKISPYYEKHNREYLESLERKRIKLTTKGLSEKLITDDLIRKTLLPQLNKEKEIRINGGLLWIYLLFRYHS